MKKLLSLLLVAVFCVSLAACGGQSAPAPAPAPAPSDSTQTPAPAPAASTEAPAQPAKKIRIGLVMQSLDNMFFVQMRDAAEAHIATLDNVEITILASKNIEEQLKVMEDLVATRPDVIAVCPYDSTGIIPAIDNAKANGIPAFCLDNNVTGTEITSFIGTNNIFGGELAGEWIIEKTGGSGKMAVLEGPAGNYNSGVRQEGMNNALAKTANSIDVVARVTANWKRDQGLNVTNDIITANPDLNLVFSLNDEMAFGAIEAIRASGKDITLIGYNGVPEAFKNIYEGNMAATVAQYPEMMATTYIDVSLSMLRNGTTPDPQYLIPAAVVDTELLRKVVDENLAPTNAEEELLYAKLKKYYKG